MGYKWALKWRYITYYMTGRFLFLSTHLNCRTGYLVWTGGVIYHPKLKKILTSFRSDKIITVTPLSGYLSIPGDSPPFQKGLTKNTYFCSLCTDHMWHKADPKKMATISASLNTYKHELLAGNVVGTPILQQHGREDDNVPTPHSRRMPQLVSEVGWETDYRGVPGKGLRKPLFLLKYADFLKVGRYND